MADPNFGTDLALADQFDPMFPLAKGRRNLIDALARRVTTDPTSEAGKGIYNSRCMDLQALLATKIDPARAGSIAQQVAKVMQYDERVAGCTATAIFDAPSKKLTITASVQPASGPSFQFVLAVTAVSV